MPRSFSSLIDASPECGYIKNIIVLLELVPDYAETYNVRTLEKR